MDVIQFYDLPYEIIEHILDLLPYVEMHRLKLVCKEWKDIFSYLIDKFTWERFSIELGLIVDRNIEGDGPDPNPNYSWFLRPSKYLCEQSKYNCLIQLYGVSQIEYTFGYPNVVQYCDFYKPDDHIDVIREKRNKWCDQVIINEVGPIQYKLMKQLTKLFVTEILNTYNTNYPIKLSFGDNMIPLLLALHQPGTHKTDKDATSSVVRFQFTSDGFMAHGENRREHDFKLFKQKKIVNNKEVWEWEGLGDGWENMTVRKILECFNPQQKADGQIFFNILSFNQNTNTISHLFEAILYIADSVLTGNPIKWE